MKRAALSAFLLVLAAAAAAAQDRRDLSAVRRDLDFGYWNTRINALYELGGAGSQSVPLLAYAAQDADWQVRHTAAHFLGKAGIDGAPALAELAQRDPCPLVRRAALQWLADMGEPARGWFNAAADPADARAIDDFPGRWSTRYMGKPLIVDAPGGMSRAFFNGEPVDFRICTSSERSGHRPAPEAVVEERLSRPEIKEVMTTIEARSRSVAVLTKSNGAPESGFVLAMEPQSFDAPPTHGSRESLDSAPAPPPHDDSFSADASRLRAGRDDQATSSVAAAHGPTQSLDGVPAVPEKTEDYAPPVALAQDAGSPRPEFDSVPVLIERLSSLDPTQRALAADLLGQRGYDAYAAVPALRRALKDPDRRVRSSAALALGDIGADEQGVRKDLKRALKDQSEDVRSSAYLALKLIDSPR